MLIHMLIRNVWYVLIGRQYILLCIYQASYLAAPNLALGELAPHKVAYDFHVLSGINWDGLCADPLLITNSYVVHQNTNKWGNGDSHVQNGGSRISSYELWVPQQTPKHNLFCWDNWIMWDEHCLQNILNHYWWRVFGLYWYIFVKIFSS